jgi:nitroreductase
MFNLSHFLDLARSRRTIRHFRPDPVAPDLLDTILECTRWAPSGYNLQPTHIVLVTEERLKKALYKPCMQQAQILEAPIIAVFTGDKQVVANNFSRVLAADLQIGAINQQYQQQLIRMVNLAFAENPLGLQRWAKALLAPLAQWFVPIPRIPAVHKDYWLAKQVALSAMMFMLATHAAGLASVPMEGFDEHRVQQVLGIPSNQLVVLVIPFGYATNTKVKKSRLPLADLVHYNGW